MVRLGGQAYEIVNDKLRIPLKPKQYFYVGLHKRFEQLPSDATLKLNPITITDHMVVLTKVNTAEVVEPMG